MSTRDDIEKRIQDALEESDIREKNRKKPLYVSCPRNTKSGRWSPWILLWRKPDAYGRLRRKWTAVMINIWKEPKEPRSQMKGDET
ncbi:hypothetical protein [Paenibacillus larvae]|uniref:hypothetical protein n=1 Tax=Paenibacillus larvae TaxID=1464 RepID=UPI00288DE044|nr:hypothetical protein [Paenibacillus larvae]MDT2191196.1 hypothetical protein [Paenibacillus larvae]MDT2237626.1 hypothetical protein [Paenibacillus larvae]MDT2242938.1 hypothetical protein [Paenibacillus larvae]MDT2248616.1 hypothetical protein [Paenibacillus larvae]MDT2258052.1 hypothetical protein [Paenibacillus larvae]